MLPDEKEEPELAFNTDPIELAPNDVVPGLVEDIEEDPALKDAPNLAPESKQPAQRWPSPLLAIDEESILDVEIPELKLPGEPVEVNLEPEEIPVLPLRPVNPEEVPPELVLNDDGPWLSELVEENKPDKLSVSVEVNPEEEPPVLVPNDDDPPGLASNGDVSRFAELEVKIGPNEPTPFNEDPVIPPGDPERPALV